MDTYFYEQNFEVLIEALEQSPDERIALDSYVTYTGGRIKFCPCRLLAEIPHFQALGVTAASIHDQPSMRGPGGAEWGPHFLAQHLFGPVGEHDAIDTLFMPYGEGERDRLLVGCLGSDHSDRALGLARLYLGLELLTKRRSPRAPWPSFEAIRQTMLERLLQLGWERGAGPAFAIKRYATSAGEREAHVSLDGPDAYHFSLSGYFDSEGLNALEGSAQLVSRVASLEMVSELVRQFAVRVDSMVSLTCSATLLPSERTSGRLEQATRFYLANVDVLLDVVTPLSDDSIYLDRYHCMGVDCPQWCLGGIVATLPYFASYGVANEGGAPLMRFADGTLMSAEDTLNHLFGGVGVFGPSAFRALFAARGRGVWDEELCARFEYRPSDRELGLARLDRAREILTRQLARAVVACRLEGVAGHAG